MPHISLHRLLFFLISLAFIAPVLCLPKGDVRTDPAIDHPQKRNTLTNGQRLARGLPPKRPRDLYNPARQRAQQNRNLQVRESTFAPNTRFPVQAAYIDSPGAIIGYARSTRAAPASGHLTIAITNDDVFGIPTTTPASQTAIYSNSVDFSNLWLYADGNNAVYNETVFTYTGVGSADVGTRFDVTDDWRIVHAGFSFYFSKAMGIIVGGRSATRVNEVLSAAAVTEADHVLLSYAVGV